MPTPLKPGDRCDGHELLRHLGGGPASEVWVARQPSGDLCAFKIMRAAGTEKERARFAREGEAIARIVHPSVVRVLGAGIWEDRPWLSLELIEGETLRQKIRPEPGASPPPIDDLLDWIQQVCEGLAAAHTRGVVHRGLDLDSIVITAGGRARLIGFEMASLTTWGVLTTRKQEIGSARNLAPEVAQGAVASPISDVYALGNVLYETLSGRHAMGDAPRSPINVIAWHIREHAAPLREIAPGVPIDLAALVHEMLAKDPSKRPPGIHAVIGRVQSVRAELRVSVLRAVRSVPQPQAVPAMAHTIPMAACDVAAPAPVASAPATSAPMSAPLMSAPVSMATPVFAPAPVTRAPSLKATERMAILPAPVSVPVPTLISALAPRMAEPVSRLPEPSLLPPAPAELRTTDTPVESVARRSSIPSRRTSVAAFLALAGAVTLAAGWFVAAHMEGPAPPRPAAAAPPPAPAPTPAAPAPSASASTTAQAHRLPAAPPPARSPRTKGTP